MDLLCSHCGRMFSAPATQPGRMVECAHCHKDVRVPDLAEGSPELAPQPLKAEDGPQEDFLTKAKLALKRKLLLECPGCHEPVTVDQRLAGRRVTCPQCAHEIMVPLPYDPQQPPRQREAPPSAVAGEAPHAHDELDEMLTSPSGWNVTPAATFLSWLLTAATAVLIAAMAGLLVGIFRK